MPEENRSTTSSPSLQALRTQRDAIRSQIQGAHQVLGALQAKLDGITTRIESLLISESDLSKAEATGTVQNSPRVSYGSEYSSVPPRSARPSKTSFVVNSKVCVLSPYKSRKGDTGTIVELGTKQHAIVVDTPAEQSTSAPGARYKVAIHNLALLEETSS